MSPSASVLPEPSLDNWW